MLNIIIHSSTFRQLFAKIAITNIALQDLKKHEKEVGERTWAK